MEQDPILERAPAGSNAAADLGQSPHFRGTPDAGEGGASATLDPQVLSEIRSLDASGALLRTAFGIFYDDGPRLFRDLSAALEAGDRDAFTFAAHTLKSCAGSVGALRVAAASSALEHAARQGEVLGPASQLEVLGQHLQEAITAMAVEGGLVPVMLRQVDE